MNLETQEVGRPEKHINLAKAIDGVDSIALELDNLITRLEGLKGTPNPTVAAEPTEPSFMEVLNEGPELLRAKTEAMHSRIEKLNELLF